MMMKQQHHHAALFSQHVGGFPCKPLILFVVPLVPFCSFLKEHVQALDLYTFSTPFYIYVPLFHIYTPPSAKRNLTLLTLHTYKRVFYLAKGFADLGNRVITPEHETDMTFSHPTP